MEYLKRWTSTRGKVHLHDKNGVSVCGHNLSKTYDITTDPGDSPICKNCLQPNKLPTQKLHPVEPVIKLNGVTIRNRPINKNVAKNLQYSETRINYTDVFCLYFKDVNASWIFSKKETLINQVEQIYEK